MMLFKAVIVFWEILFFSFISTTFVFPVERLSDVLALSDGSTSKFYQGIDSLFSNPAGISGAHLTQLKTSYATYFENQYAIQALSLVLPLSQQLTLGLGVPVRKIDDIPLTVSDKGVGLVVGSFTDIEIEGLCSLAYQFLDQFSIGMNISPLYHKLYDQSATALTSDLGVLYSDISQRTFVSFSVKNILSTPKKWSSGFSESLTPCYQASLSTAITSEIDVYAETSFEILSKQHVTIGTNLVFDQLICSAGLIDAWQTNQFLSGVELKTDDLTIQYHMTSHPSLGVCHQFGVTFNL